jgi:Tfp pilus assembly protein PilN
MSDINFLPVEQQAREALEAKQNILAKERAEIKLSTPSPLKPANINLKMGQKKSGLFGVLKNIFAKKNKPVSPLPPKPFVPYNVNNQAGDKKFNVTVNNDQNKNNNLESSEPAKITTLPVSSGLIAPINAAAWSQAPKLTPTPTPTTNINLEPKMVWPTKEVEMVDMDDKKMEQKKDEGNKNKMGEKSFSLATGKARQEIEINLMTGEEQIKTMEPGTKMLIFVAVTVGLILIFGGLFFYTDWKVKKTMTEKVTLENKISDLRNKIKEANENNKAVSELQPQLVQLQKILDNHALAVKLFTYLEASTVVGVYYTDMEVEVIDGKVGLTGVALDYAQAAQQLLVFNGDKENIQAVDISEITKQEDKITKEQEARGGKPRELVNFGISLTLTDGFFK